MLTLLLTVRLLEAQTPAATDIAATDTAPEALRHEIAIYGAEGLSILNYNLDKDGRTTGEGNEISGQLGLSYTLNINQNIGITAAIELSKYGAETLYETLSDEKIYGTNRNRFNFRYSINRYTEQQQITLLTLPLMAQYATPLSRAVKLYVAAGIKTGIPLRSEATVSPHTLNTSGYYYFENQTYTSLPQHGFVSAQQTNATTRDIDTNIAITAAIETGARFNIYSNIIVYTSIYLDYGLNNIRSTSDQQVVNYQTLEPSEFRYASILNTSHVDKVKIFGIGLKLKISLGW
jgi:hypothetical protein